VEKFAKDFNISTTTLTTVSKNEDKNNFLLFLIRICKKTLLRLWHFQSNNILHRENLDLSRITQKEFLPNFLQFLC